MFGAHDVPLRLSLNPGPIPDKQQNNIIRLPNEYETAKKGEAHHYPQRPL